MFSECKVDRKTWGWCSKCGVRMAVSLTQNTSISLLASNWQLLIGIVYHNLIWQTKFKWLTFVMDCIVHITDLHCAGSTCALVFLLSNLRWSHHRERQSRLAKCFFRLLKQIWRAWAASTFVNLWVHSNVPVEFSHEASLDLTNRWILWFLKANGTGLKLSLGSFPRLKTSDRPLSTSWNCIALTLNKDGRKKDKAVRSELRQT